MPQAWARFSLFCRGDNFVFVVIKVCWQRSQRRVTLIPSIEMEARYLAAPCAQLHRQKSLPMLALAPVSSLMLNTIHRNMCHFHFDAWYKAACAHFSRESLPCLHFLHKFVSDFNSADWLPARASLRPPARPCHAAASKVGGRPGYFMAGQDQRRRISAEGQLAVPSSGLCWPLVKMSALRLSPSEGEVPVFVSLLAFLSLLTSM